MGVFEFVLAYVVLSILTLTTVDYAVKKKYMSTYNAHSARNMLGSIVTIEMYILFIIIQIINRIYKWRAGRSVSSGESIIPIPLLPLLPPHHPSPPPTPNFSFIQLQSIFVFLEPRDAIAASHVCIRWHLVWQRGGLRHTTPQP